MTTFLTFFQATCGIVAGLLVAVIASTLTFTVLGMTLALLAPKSSDPE